MGVQSPEPREPVSGLCEQSAKSGLGWEGGISGLSGDGRAEGPWPDLRIKGALESTSPPNFHPERQALFMLNSQMRKLSPTEVT